MIDNDTIAVVLHFRTVGATADCLESLRLSGIQHLVLVDNSEDGGRSLYQLSPHLKALRAGGMSSEVVSTGLNLGFARGVNVGVVHALAAGAGRILLINSDARLASGALHTMCTDMANQAGGVVAPLIVSSDGNCETVLYYQALLGVMLRSQRMLSVDYLSGACLLVHRAVAEKFPFDESFFFYCEDVAWSHRLAKAEVPMHRSCSAVAFHSGAGSSRNGSFFYEYHTVRGHWLLALRLLRSPAQKALGLLLRLCTLSARALLRCSRTRSTLPVRALLLATLDLVRRRRVSFTPSAAEWVSGVDAQP